LTKVFHKDAPITLLAQLLVKQCSEMLHWPNCHWNDCKATRLKLTQPFLNLSAAKTRWLRLSVMDQQHRIKSDFRLIAGKQNSISACRGRYGLVVVPQSDRSSHNLFVAPEHNGSDKPDQSERIDCYDNRPQETLCCTESSIHPQQR